MDALVAGAGVAGCTAARLLAEAGLDVVLAGSPGPPADRQLVHERTASMPGAAGVAEVVLSFGSEAPRRYADPGLAITSRVTLLAGLRAAARDAGARLVTAEAELAGGDA
ncbi:hypothetical protein, partial [Amycolatopsis sp.]|uniref:hypothetical protein n=1 Tax=Amycolatopsis sp. TaxID=37632 RepID=UPI002DAAA32E|nr:hypothetical protein [Amycolatopsis sp.]